jgi:hypothetical protein
MPSSSPYTRTGHRKIRFEHRGKVGLRGKPDFEGYLGNGEVFLGDHVFCLLAQFTSGRDEYLPIPQAEINLTHGLYVQNNGW